MADVKLKSCDDCQHGSRLYADGYIFRNWSGRFDGDPKTLPMPADDTNYWTYVECAKNNKGLKFLNVEGKCNGFQKKK